jgi:hypothetical protein
MKQLAEMAPLIGDLERKKELEENNYKYFANTLEKARVDEALDPSKIPNISAVQRPSPPFPVTSKRHKIALGCAVGGLALGIAFALLRELVLNQTLKRPTELEGQLQTSLLLAIPDASSNGHVSLPPITGSDGSTAIVVSRRENLAPWDAGHFIRTYCEAIRDRIGLYFDLHQLTHKPKLVGVTAFSQGAGTSTLAAGLAAALSETDEGKVLLVDVNLGPDHVHPFFKGKPAYPLTTALQERTSMDAASENLYLATVGSSKTGLAQLGLKKFFDLMPNLRRAILITSFSTCRHSLQPVLLGEWRHSWISFCSWSKRRKQPGSRQARIRQAHGRTEQRLSRLEQDAVVYSQGPRHRELTFCLGMFPRRGESHHAVGISYPGCYSGDTRPVLHATEQNLL